MASDWTFVPVKGLCQHLGLAWLYFPGAAPAGPGMVEEVPSAFSLHYDLSLHFHHKGQKHLQ